MPRRKMYAQYSSQRGNCSSRASPFIATDPNQTRRSPSWTSSTSLTVASARFECITRRGLWHPQVQKGWFVSDRAIRHANPRVRSGLAQGCDRSANRRHRQVALSLQEIRSGRAGPQACQNLVGIVFHADRIRTVVRSVHVRGGLLARAESIDLEFHLVAVRIGIVHRDRHTVVDAPVGQDTLLLQLRVVLEEVIHRRVGIGDVIYTDGAAPIALVPVRLDHSQVDQCDPMVLVIISQKRQRGVLELYFCVEHRPIPLDHLLEAPGTVDHMHKPCGPYTRHGGFHSLLVTWFAAILLNRRVSEKPRCYCVSASAFRDRRSASGPSFHFFPRSSA